MTYVLVALITWSIFSLYYIHRLKTALHSHEAGWNQIEEISDHNQDGDVVIHIQHVPENKPTVTVTEPIHHDKDSW